MRKIHVCNNPTIGYSPQQWLEWAHPGSLHYWRPGEEKGNDKKKIFKSISEVLAIRYILSITHYNYNSVSCKGMCTRWSREHPWNPQDWSHPGIFPGSFWAFPHGLLKGFFFPWQHKVCRYSVTARKMIALNGWPHTSVKCLPEVSFYYQNEAKNNKPVKRHNFQEFIQAGGAAFSIET